MQFKTNKDREIQITSTEVLTERELSNLKQAIASSLPTFGGVYELKRIPGNLSPSARVYKLIAGDDVFVVRILNLDLYLEDSTHEIKLLTDLSKHHVTPPLYHADVNTGIVIMKFIKDTPVFRGGLRETEKALIELAKKVKQLHTLPQQAKSTNLLPSNLQKERLKEVYQRATTHEAFQIYLQGVEYLNQLSIFIRSECFCHNNLHKYNVLHADGESYIIDWETAGIGDPFLDLANFVALARFSKEQEAVFLTAYLDHKPTELEWARFEIMKQISLLRFSLGHFTTVKLNEVTPNSLDFDKLPRYTDPSYQRSLSSAQDQFIVSFSMLKEAFHSIRSPNFVDAVRILSKEQKLPEGYLHLRLFAFANPKAIERAQQAVKPHLTKESTPAIASLSGGSEQATNYKVRLNEGTIALRVNSEGTSAEQFLRELSLYEHAASLGLGPKVRFSDTDLLCLATDFVETPNTNWQRNLSNAQLSELAQQIKKLHATPFSMQKNQQTLTGLPLRSLHVAENLAKEFSTMQDVVSLYKRLLTVLKPEVLSHNSLSRDNILFDGNRFHFIDWENATINDRLYDPAFLSCYFFLSPEQERVLLRAYLGHEITRAEGQRFYLIKLLVLCHLSIVTLTKCHDIEFIKTLPQLEPSQRYFTYEGKARHLLNLQTDFAKFLIYQLLINEVRFAMTTGKFRACEKKFLQKKEVEDLSFSELPLLAQRAIFSSIPRKKLAEVRVVNKNWARTFCSLADDSFPIPTGIEKIHERDRNRLMTALKATFMPYKPQHTKIDAILSPAVIASIIPFTAGLSPWANTCKLVINDKPYVIRLMSLEPDSSCAKLEVLIMKLFSAMGAAPKIHYASESLGVIIMDLVDATPEWYRSITPEVLSQLGLLFHQMNEIPIGPGMKHPFVINKRLQEIYERVYHLCRKECATDPRFALFRNILNQLDELKPLCDALTEPTLCHHDFNVWNVLQQKGDLAFKAIDFEFSQSGDRLFDLGSLVVFMRLDKKTETELLCSFFGRKPTEQEQSKYYLFKQYAWLHYIVMGLGICKSYDFQITDKEMDELPPFNEFSRSTQLSTPLDPHTDVGHYKLAVMFIKQAALECQNPEYQTSIELLRSQKATPSL